MFYDIIIIGGGIGGIYTLYKLSQKYPELRILLIEKEKQLGGRISTFVEKGMVLEKGAGRFNDSHIRLIQLIQELHLKHKIRKTSTEVVYMPDKNGKYEENQSSINILDSLLGMVLGKDNSKQKLEKLILRVIIASFFESKQTLMRMSFIQYSRKILTKNQIQYIENSFGYYKELHDMNAYNCIQLLNVLNPMNNNYVMNGGLSTIIEKLVDNINKNKNCLILTDRKVNDIQLLSGGEHDTFQLTLDQTLSSHSSTPEFSVQASSSTPPLLQTLATPKSAAEGSSSEFKRNVMPNGSQRLASPKGRGGPRLCTFLQTLSSHSSTPPLLQESSIKYYCDKIICALPREALIQFPIFKTIREKWLDKITSGSLCRIYSRFAKNADGRYWFQDLPKITTNNALRMMIPYDLENGVIMISYTDSQFADYWYRLYRSKGIHAMNRKIKKLVKEITDIDIPKPLDTKIFYWEMGEGYWDVGADSEYISSHVLKPFEKMDLYICGENYSGNYQQWIEGALDTSQKVVDLI